MTAPSLRQEVEEAVARVDLAPPQREAVGATRVEAGLARDGGTKAGGFDKPALAEPEEARRVREQLHRAVEPGLERRLRADDLLARRLVPKREEVRMGEGVGLEAQRPLAVELDDLVPPEHGRLLAVPVEPRPACGYGGRDEDRGAEASLLEDRQRLLCHVEVAVVEAQTDGLRGLGAAVEQLERGEHVDDAVGLGGEVVHLAPKVARSHRKLVAVVGDPVVEEDAEADALGPTLRADEPDGRARAGECSLERVAAHESLPRSFRAGASPSM